MLPEQADTPRLSWNQSVCPRCWNDMEPDRPLTRDRDGTGEPDWCSYCGWWHVSGIYRRADPACVPYPRPKDY